ncbi:MAG: hypothetical protein ACJAYU_004500, partial [Bradymonadia bacterium]
MLPHGAAGSPTHAPSGGLGLTTEALATSRRRVENVAWIVMTLLVISSPFQVIMYFTGEFSLPQMQQNLLGALLVV